VTLVRAGGAVAVAVAVLLALAPASAADTGSGFGGSNQHNQFSAWAFYGQATGGGAVSSPESCDLEGQPGQPAHHHYDVFTFNGGVSYVVFHLCVSDFVPELVHGSWGTELSLFELRGIDEFPAAPPEVMVSEVLARLDPRPPAIETSPGGGLPGLVGMPVSLGFADGAGLRDWSGGFGDGPLWVDLHATPTGDVAWDAGDDREACTAVPPAPCEHTYVRSSIGQPDADAQGRPAYTITAGVTYEGIYQVFVNGAPLGPPIGIGGVSRSVATTLAVNEAQALTKG
jgi:hypothetical protein